MESPIRVETDTQHPAGDHPAPRLVLLHGFAQNARCWGTFGEGLRSAHEVLRVDAPGHGQSGDADLGIAESATEIVKVCGRGTYVGYSMGGRLALRAALDHPDQVERLVLISATAGIEEDDERAARRADDESLASRIETDGVDAFVDEWLASPMFAGLPPEHRFEAERRTNTAAGLAASLRNCGTGSMEPLWDRLGELRVPVLLLAGARDGKYAAVAQRMKEVIGANATLVVVGGAGHATHLESPAATLATVQDWLRRKPTD